MTGRNTDHREADLSETTNPLTGAVPDTAAPAPGTPSDDTWMVPPDQWSATDVSASACLPRPFGEYELLAEIARGGMGVVYKARQKGLDRLVALKMILTGPHAATRTDLERFVREARAAAALDHPNIVPVYDNGVQDGHAFFTMALIDGTSLQQRVQKEGPPEPREAVRLMRAVADALAYAHGQGILHRDLKPHNILVDRQGRPRVADFGLARRTQEAQGLTRTGDVLGTPHYMAPEQARGQVALLGPPADVYGLGGILYYLLTGRPPFTGETAVSILCSVMEQAPRPPREIRGEVPPELEAICLKCLEKDLANRYPSAAALSEALAEWEARQGTGGTPSSTERLPTGGELRPASGRRRGLLLGAAGILGVGLCVLGLWLWNARRPQPDENPTPPAPSVPPGERAVSLPELPKDLRHDFGLKVELVGGREGPDGLRVFQEDEPVRYRLETQRDAYVGIWTIGPDGTVVQLFPNKYETDYLVRAGQPRLVPGNDDYQIAATASPPGKAELLRVVAATWRWEPLKGKEEGPFVILQGGRERLERHLRSMEIRPKSEPTRSATDAVAEAALPYQVRPR
jgi:serine/threonine protein kinase